MKILQLLAVTLLPVFSLFLPIGIASDVPFADVPFDINNIPEPVPPPQEVRDFFELDPFYQQWINVGGFPVLTSAEVSPYAVKEAAWTIGHMIGHRPDILKAMAQIKARLSIVPHNKHLSDIPEYDFGRVDFFWDIRARGIGGIDALTTTSAEESIICRDSNYCWGELIHEFAHELHSLGLNRIDSTFDSRLETLYNAALKEGLYQGRYAGSNRDEYWAEGVGSWFHGSHPDNVAHTRLALKEYDPRLATLLTEVFGDGSWRYTPPSTRTHLPHLQGFNPQEAPIYQRPPELLELEKQLLDPNSDGGGKWVNLELYHPSGLSHLKKQTKGGNHTDFLFRNLTGTDLALYFFNANGKKIFRQYIDPNNFWHFYTEVGVIWLIQDHTGKDLAVFRAEKQLGRVLFTPTPFLITSGLSKISGDNQSGVPGTVLANPFVVEVRAEDLSVPEGISVTFTVTAGNGILSATHTTTDENGRAESTLTLGQNRGINTVSVSVNGIVQPVIFNAVAETAAVIPDANLRAAIENALGKAPGTPIMPSDMAKLTYLGEANANIGDLTGLEHATNLTGLGLWDNRITDISALSGLTNLRELGLGGNSVTDISVVSGLTNLTSLHLPNNPISDLSVVSGLTGLTYLNLNGTTITDISSLSGLTNLTELYLAWNNITNISVLSGLTNLTTLWLMDNNITDLSPLVANTGFGSGDKVNVRQNPLSYRSIHTHIRALQSRGITVEFDLRQVQTLLKISGDTQQGNVGEELTDLFIVEVRDQNGAVFGGVPVTFAVTAGDGTLSVTRTTTDNNGRAESRLTLGARWGAHTVLVSAADTANQVVFNAVAKPITTEYLWSIPAGISLIHVPLKVITVDSVDQSIESISDLYDILGGALTVNFLITYDSQAQDWQSYFSASDRGTPADSALTDDMGIIAGMTAPVSILLRGVALGTDGRSTFTLNQGLNLVGIPLRDARITRVSDLFKVDGIGGNVPVIILTDGGDFKSVGRAGDPGDISITGGQGFLLTAQQQATVTISGEAWTNTSATAAPPSLSLKGIEGRDTTPVLVLRGAVVDEHTGLNKSGFRVTVKNLSAGKAAAVVATPDGAGYRLTVVDIETGRAATIGNTLEISAQSPNPFIGVEPMQYTVTAEDVRWGLIQLPELLAYEIPIETELLSNYPNPFNPETWIPYRLAEDAFVTLTIYDQVGRVVRLVDVGHRIAAVYENRSKAIYWDGRNEFGESVASGVYFYQLQVSSSRSIGAGDYSATRKMVILK